MSLSPDAPKTGPRPFSRLTLGLLVLVLAGLLFANRGTLLHFPDEVFAPAALVPNRPLTASEADAIAEADADSPWQVARERRSETAQVAQMLRHAARCRPPRLERLPGYATALAFYQQGAALDQQGLYAEALQDYRAAASFTPRWVRPDVDMGWDWKKLSRLDQAVQVERTAVRLDPTDADGYYGVGDMLLEQHRYEVAVPFYRVCVHLDPSYWMGQRRLNAIFDGQRRWQEAITAGHAWSRLQPRDAQAHDAMDYEYFMLGDFRRSIQECRSALRLSPTDALAHENLGDALVALGRKAEARAQWRRALQLEPSGDNAAKARAMLAKYP